MTRIPPGATYADAIERCCSHRSPLRRDGECQDCLDEANDYIDPAELAAGPEPEPEGER